MTRVLHLTPHLGGGVGKALACVAEDAARQPRGFAHRIACLEPPLKRTFADRIERAGVPLVVAPDPAALAAEVEAAELVQLEFWNHPATVAALCAGALPPLRLIAWCHVSGLHWPWLPAALVRAAHRFLLTSPCSLAAAELREAAPAPGQLAVVSSGAGLEDLPPPPPRPGGRARFGYLGSLNFAKLHPDYAALLAAVPLPDLRVRLVGDLLNRDALQAQCAAHGRPGLLEFAGYTDDAPAALARFDVLVYLLNPTHYGTAENALIEAMAMGVVPVVWDNPAERAIVAHGETGVVVRSAAELAQALLRLDREPAWRARLGAAAAAAVRERYTTGHLGAALAAHYREVLAQPRRAIDFAAVFGATPGDWFRAFARGSTIFRDDGGIALPPPAARHALFERTKGSVFHFRDRFPDEAPLAAWAATLASPREALR